MAMVTGAAVLVNGLGLLESARWHAGSAWFSDWLSGTIYRVDGAAVTPVQSVPALPLCFDFIGDELVVFDSASARLLRGRPDDELKPCAEVPFAKAGNEIITVSGGGCYLNFGNFDPEQGFPTEPVGLVAHVEGPDCRAWWPRGWPFPTAWPSPTTAPR